MGGLEGCERLSADLQAEWAVAEKYVARHFLSTQRALGNGGLDNAYWRPGLGNPARGLAKAKSDMLPLLRLPQ